MASIAVKLQQVRERIAAACAAAQRPVQSVTLLAVSKTFDADAVREAHAAGQHAFGENYVQEALQKMQELPALEWHLIGPLQSNKTRAAAEHFHWVQTLASEKIARRLSEQRPVRLPPLNVLIQVNVSGEASKSGIAPGQARELAQAISNFSNLKLRGLMAIPEPGAERARYREVKKLYDELKTEFGFDTLSMGMSDDLEVALAEGSTMVRIGTAIFGPRGVGSLQKHKDAA
jgi:PLP dependent protein